MAEVKVPKGISKDQFLDMVRAGVHDAMRELISGTANPTADFYGAVRDGGREAVRATVSGFARLQGGGRVKNFANSLVADRGGPEVSLTWPNFESLC